MKQPSRSGDTFCDADTGSAAANDDDSDDVGGADRGGQLGQGGVR